MIGIFVLDFVVVGESGKLQLSPSLQVVKSPGTKPGALVLCERVHIHGLSRLKKLEKVLPFIKGGSFTFNFEPWQAKCGGLFP